jgi:hypothetical protein
MKQAGRSLRALRESAFDSASLAKDLEAVQGLQSGLVAAKATFQKVPMAPQAKTKFGGDEAAYHAAFRRDLIQSAQQALALELALLDGKSADAKALVEKLTASRDAAHTLFQREE